MSWTVADHASSYTSGGTCALHPTAAISVGALVVAGTIESTNNTSAPSITDSKSNTYTIIHRMACDSDTRSTACLFYAILTASLTTSDTITYHPVSSSADQGMLVLSAKGFAAVLDTAVTATFHGNIGGSSSLTSGTPSMAGELFVAFGACTNSGQQFNLDSTNGWSAPFDNGGWTNNTASGVGAGGGYQINSGTGTKKYNPTTKSGNPDYASMIVGFEPIQPYAAAGVFNMPMLGM